MIEQYVQGLDIPAEIVWGTKDPILGGLLPMMKLRLAQPEHVIDINPLADELGSISIDGSDLVIGSRYTAGGGVTDWGILRRFVSRGGSLFARIVLRLQPHDLTGGFKCFRREVLEAMPLDRIKSDGYSFQIEMNYHCWRRGMAIKEIPIMFVDRQVGVSKMNRKIIIEAMWMVWALRLRRTHRAVRHRLRLRCRKRLLRPPGSPLRPSGRGRRFLLSASGLPGGELL